MCLALVRIGRSHQVHRNVGIDEDQPWYPRPISLSICFRSAVGKEYCAPRRTGFSFVSGSITGRAARASRSTRRTHGSDVTLGQALDVGHLDIGKHHLKALTHRVSTTSRPLSWCVALRAAAEEAQVDPWAHPYPLDQTEAVAGPEALQPCRRPSSP